MPAGSDFGARVFHRNEHGPGVWKPAWVGSLDGNGDPDLGAGALFAVDQAASAARILPQVRL
jgi:hypothetical protein